MGNPENDSYGYELVRYTREEALAEKNAVAVLRRLIDNPIPEGKEVEVLINLQDLIPAGNDLKINLSVTGKNLSKAQREAYQRAENRKSKEQASTKE